MKISFNYSTENVAIFPQNDKRQTRFETLKASLSYSTKSLINSTSFQEMSGSVLRKNGTLFKFLIILGILVSVHDTCDVACEVIHL